MVPLTTVVPSTPADEDDDMIYQLSPATDGRGISRITVLTAVDGEQTLSRGVEVGHELAQQFGDELVVLHIMPQQTFEEYREATTEQHATSFPSLAPGISYGDETAGGSQSSTNAPFSIQDGEQDAAGVAREVVAGTLAEWDDVTFQGRVGEPVEEILDETERRDARYLVAGGRGRTPVGKAVFGNITQSLLLSAELPVMTVMEGE